MRGKTLDKIMETDASTTKGSAMILKRLKKSIIEESQNESKRIHQLSITSSCGNAGMRGRHQNSTPPRAAQERHNNRERPEQSKMKESRRHESRSRERSSERRGVLN
jgi:hypothetical protein